MMRRYDLIRMIIGCVFFCTCSFTLQAEKPLEIEFFQSKVEPLLKEKCLGCHSHEAIAMEGGLTLDSKAGWSEGGDRGPAIIPGKPDESLVLTAVKYENDDLQMPPGEKLSDEEIAILREWIKRGAVDPREVTKSEQDLTDWWSLRKLIAPPVPGEGHSIDAFVRSRLNEHKLSSTNRASKTELIRRLVCRSAWVAADAGRSDLVYRGQ